MQLIDILNNSTTELSQRIKDIAFNSGKVKPGDLFVAITCDGIAAHITDAIKNGAIAVVIEEEILALNKKRLPHATYITVKNARQSLSELAVKFYPEQPGMIMAVTGTNGKSSIVSFIRQIWNLLGTSGASFGTLGLETTDDVILPNISLPKLTTPDAISLHQLLSNLSKAGVEHFVFEASSHGIDQYRLHSAKINVAGFTNLTQDHLDYHLNMESYFEAKSKLFTQLLLDNGMAVINNDSEYATALKLLLKVRNVRVLTYGLVSPSDLFAANIRFENSSIKFDLITENRTWENLQVSVVSNFQIENILCAIGMVMADGVSLEEIVNILPRLTSAIGRMQFVGVANGGASIYVDYAHTPDALSRALQSLKDHLKGKLHVVFGCGGNRDTDKRAAMGMIAQNLADVVYITDDNPRLEDAEFIRAQILSGCDKGQEVADRYIAIEKAINGLKSEDILLIAGKGHETGQTIMTEIIPFCDIEVVRQILSRVGNGCMERI